ncbi:flavoprotein [Methyloversatilis thermotolerans]|uniref:flavoprotein n=1 Tax=Methyloversatilis thermotolerans TaxID=1346290 RepID=UPI0006891098|nr:flavoprotein [Methyloversatilis thermotolerans]
MATDPRMQDIPDEAEVLPDARIAWGLTGSGHFLKESLALIDALSGVVPADADAHGVDLFMSRAGEEVLNMYGYPLADMKKRYRVFRDSTASAAPVGLFYQGQYHTVVVAPATSNTVAKCACGISDTLVTNIFAQAGKLRIPVIVFACDNEPVVVTESPSEWVTLYPRAIDLAHTARLAEFEGVTVVNSVEALASALKQRLACLTKPSPAPASASSS